MRQAAVEHYAIFISSTLTTPFWLTRVRSETDVPMHDSIIRHSARGFLDVVEKPAETSGRDEIPPLTDPDRSTPVTISSSSDSVPTRYD